MIRNWYAVYTRPNKERRVGSILSKKGIENYCPVVFSEPGKPANKKQSLHPLFNSFVFVQITEAEIGSIIALPWVINLIYWRSRPAVISSREIEIIKKLTANYSNIKLEKTSVDVNASITILDEPTISYSEKAVSVKYKSVKVNLPSLGYTVLAERVKQEEKTGYQPSSILSSFPKRINAFFFN